MIDFLEGALCLLQLVRGLFQVAGLLLGAAKQIALRAEWEKRHFYDSGLD